MYLPESRNKPSLLLIFSIIFSMYYIDLGFAFKPYMIFCILFFVLSAKVFKVHYLRFYEVSMLAFFLYYCLTGFLSSYPMYSLRFIMGIILIIFCYFVMRYVLSLSSINGIKNALTFGGLTLNALSLLMYLMGLFALGFNFQGNRIYIYGVMLDRSFPRLTGLMSDPNIFVFYNVVFFFYFITHLEQRWSKIGTILSATTILLSMSRGGILAVAAGLFALFIFSNVKKKLRLLIVIPLASIVINYFLKTVANIDVFGMIANRFLADDGGSGRDSIWGRALTLFQDNPLFGIGIFNYRPYSQDVYGTAAYMHNTYLEALVEGGIIGLALYLLIFASVIITYWNNRKTIKDNGYLFYTFIAMAVLMATYSFMVNEAFFLVLAILWRYLYEVKHPKRLVDKPPKKRNKYRLTW